MRNESRLLCSVFYTNFWKNDSWSMDIYLGDREKAVPFIQIELFNRIKTSYEE